MTRSSQTSISSLPPLGAIVLVPDTSTSTAVDARSASNDSTDTDLTVGVALTLRSRRALEPSVCSRSRFCLNSPVLSGPSNVFMSPTASEFIVLTSLTVKTDDADFASSKAASFC